MHGAERGRNKDYIGKAVRKYTKMFASWRDLKINVEFVEEDIATIVYSIDGVSFATSEFRKHPSTYMMGLITRVVIGTIFSAHIIIISQFLP